MASPPHSGRSKPPPGCKQAGANDRRERQRDNQRTHGTGSVEAPLGEGAYPASGKVRFENVEEGVTVAKQIDEVTGLSTLVDPKRRGVAQSKGLRPLVKFLGDDGNEIKVVGSNQPVSITFQIGCIITVRDGQQVSVGEVLEVFRKKLQKLEILPVVCRELQIYLKLVVLRYRLFWQRFRVL